MSENIGQLIWLYLRSRENYNQVVYRMSSGPVVDRAWEDVEAHERALVSEIKRLAVEP